MARKIMNRKELRKEFEAAEGTEEEVEVDEEEQEEGEEEEAAPKVAKKAPAKRKSRAKTPKEVRLKAFWGVFNQSLKRVALYEFSQKKEADKKAKELTASGKSPHFVQPVKEA